MLSHIQQATSFSGTNVTSNKAQSLELKILNALATIIVMNNEIVAVVANRDNGDGQLEVIACVHLIRDEEELSPKISEKLFRSSSPPKIPPRRR
ncbi:hypothetical protein L208DRAFT_1402121 [Tricholoma matsutake]|nr:hypothetical protein L208DRAFT_1402121 [Tricholoma matsutake 945]